MLFVLAYSYLTTDNIFRRWEESKRYTYLLTKPFLEFSRIARNRPFDGIDPAYPKTTDGTTAAIIRKTPRRIVQQLPTGKVISDDDGWLGIVADFILQQKIILKANEDYNLIQKAWTTIENGLTFGSCATYTPFINHDGYFSPDLTIPYWGDLGLQKGKKSGMACDYLFIRSWWQKADVEALIASETKMAAKAKKRGEDYEGTWDTKALQKLVDNVTAKDWEATAPFEYDRGISPEGIELITGFQKGVGSIFYTFAPDGHLIVRTKKNKDPRGQMPINWFYGDIDGNNPLGRGIVELVGGLQNLIDSDMQMYQYNRALMLAPPVIKYGNIGDFKFAPNAVIDASNDPTAKIIPLSVDTSAVANYPNLYGLQKSQLLNLVNSPDTSISATLGNPSFSKTTAGVNQQQATISVDDNFIEKMFETWFKDWCEGAINLFFAERHGKEELQLNKETAMKLRELPGFQENLLSSDNKILIDYDIDTPALKFVVDPGTSTVKDNAAQVQDATNLLDMVMKFPMLNSMFGGPIDTDVLARRIVVNSGIDDPEQVAPELTAAQKESKELQKNQVSPFSPFFDKPSIKMDYAELPPAAQLQILSNAGVHVQPQDIMQGPIANINTRGNTALNKPLDDPSQLMPGGSFNQSPTMQAPIDIGDIYKQTTDPAIKAQIERMAGLQPDENHVQNQINSNTVEHTAKQVSGINQVHAQNALSPVPQQPDQQDAQQVEAQLRQLGLSDQAVQQAMQMIAQGANGQQVAQSLRSSGNA